MPKVLALRETSEGGTLWIEVEYAKTSTGSVRVTRVGEDVSGRDLGLSRYVGKTFSSPHKLSRELNGPSVAMNVIP